MVNINSEAYEEEKKKKARESARRYYFKNREKVLARQKVYAKKKYHEDPEYKEKVYKNSRRYVMKNKEKVREAKRKWARKHYEELREKGLLPPTKQQRIDRAIEYIERDLANINIQENIVAKNELLQIKSILKGDDKE